MEGSGPPRATFCYSPRLHGTSQTASRPHGQWCQAPLSLFLRHNLLGRLATHHPCSRRRDHHRTNSSLAKRASKAPIRWSCAVRPGHGGRRRGQGEARGGGGHAKRRAREGSRGHHEKRVSVISPRPGTPTAPESQHRADANGGRGRKAKTLFRRPKNAKGESHEQEELGTG
jgi:hypothetical protein